MAPSALLDAGYILEAEQRARRFSGAYTGTSGTLAADVLRLLKERQHMTAAFDQLEADNAALREAVAARLQGTNQPESSTAIDDADVSPIPVDWILQGERELRGDQESQPLGIGVVNAQPDNLRPGSREFLAILDELRELHLKKTLDYGVDEDALSNIRSSADIVNLPAWAGCVLRMMDKMHRLKAYFRRGRVEFDGLSDTLKDIACYAVIAEVLRREGETP